MGTSSFLSGTFATLGDHIRVCLPHPRGLLPKQPTLCFSPSVTLVLRGVVVVFVAALPAFLPVLVMCSIGSLSARK